MHDDLAVLKERIKDYLPQYLQSQGINPNKQFKCISPDHADTNPSAGIIKNNPRLGHCLSCGTSFDIYDAAAFLEGKPASGPAWMTDNLFYLATKFGLDIPQVDLSPQEIHEMEIYRAYNHAYQIIKSSEINNLVQQKLNQYSWTKEAISKFGIGSVTTYQSYYEKMTKIYKYKPTFLEECDLNNKFIFHPNRLIYPFKDEHGNPVGFSSRNLNYEEEKAAFDLETEKDPQGKLFKPRKYFNTSSSCAIFQKSKILYGFDQAKKVATYLFIFEGQADTVTAWSGGIKNAVGICSTAFSKDHLDLILRHGITHLVFVLDDDKAGQTATNKFMALANECQGKVGLRLEAVVLPNGHDPDSFIRSYGDLQSGAKAFRNLPRIDSFTWQLEQAVEAGADPITMCHNILPSIVNEPDNILRNKMADQLAEATGQDKFFVRRELKRLLDEDSMKAEEERLNIANELSAALRKDPQAIQSILSSANSKLEQIERKSNKFTVENVLKSVSHVFDYQDKNIDRLELVSGFKLFDTLVGGFPKEGCFATCPGKSHHGKSIWLDNLIIGLLENNPDLIVLLHSVDDDKIQRIPRILGTKFNLSSDLFRKAGYYVKGDGAKDYPKFEEQYQTANKWLNDMISSERFFIADSGDLPGDLDALKSWAKAIRHRHPNRPMIIVGDNFHLYDMRTNEIGEQKTRAMSRFLVSMVSELRISSIFTMEIPKEGLKVGTRPSYLNMKNSGGLTFDSKMNFSVYQELQDFSGMKGNTWINNDVLSESKSYTGEHVYGGTQMPILEVILDKNKINGRTQTIFYKLNSTTGKMIECSEQEQRYYKGQNEQREAENRKQRKGY